MNTLVIDGSNLLFRAFWIADTRPKFLNSKGEWTGPVYLFLKSLKSLQDKFKPNETWICWDKKKNYPSTNFRKQLALETYKSNRDTELASKVHEQFSLVEPWLNSLGIKQMFPWTLEADDVISWLTKEKFTQSTIVSVDQDLLQLVDKNTVYFNPIKKKLITLENFEEEVGVNISYFVYYKALLGDKSDNIEGVPGYGVVKSKRLVTEGYDGILKALPEEYKGVFEKNVQMVDLLGSYNKEQGEVESYETQFEEQKCVKPSMKEFEQMCYKAEFYSFVKALDSWKDSFTRNQALVNLVAQFQ